MGEFRMPSLGADMDEGTIVEWRVAPGDRVARGDVVAVVDTDKSDIDAEVFEDGVVGELLVDAGETVPVGTVLATIVVDGSPTAPTATAPASDVVAVSAPTAPTASRPPAGHRPRITSPLVRHLAEQYGLDADHLHSDRPGGLVTRADVEAAARALRHGRISPRARRLAAVRGLDPTTLAGTGPEGAVIGADVEAAAAPAAPSASPMTPPARDHEVGMRRRIASLMERSNAEIPHYWVQRDLDLGRATDWLRQHNAGRPPQERLVAAALLLAATARAAAEAPTLNGHWLDGDLRPADTVHLGLIVVLRSGGLLAPVIPDAQRLTVDQVMTAMADLVRRARADHLRSGDLRPPTITVSNLGDQGADAVFGMIHPPQLALVGYGRVADRPWAEGGLLGVRPVVTATVAGDHRASEGHAASRFLASVDRWLQEPERLEEVD